MFNDWISIVGLIVGVWAISWLIDIFKGTSGLSDAWEEFFSLAGWYFLMALLAVPFLLLGLWWFGLI
jgi:hypothetical protein